MPELPIEESARNPESVKCPIATECGGCARITEPYVEQLAWKTERVRAALARHEALVGVEVESCLAAPERWRYRNRAKLAVAGSGGVVRIGLYQRGTNRIVDLAPCVVQRPVLQRGLEHLRHWLSVHGLAAPLGPVFYVDLREMSGGRFHATFVVAANDVRETHVSFDDLLAGCAELGAIAVNFGDPASSYPMGDTTRVVVGGDTFDAPLFDEGGELASFAVPVSGFFQVATSLLPEVHRRMRAHLGDDGALYDLYCGVGVHGLMVERDREARSPGIVGIEESTPACAAARANADQFGVPARYFAGRVEDLLDAALAEQASTRFVLNPGRSGCRPRVLELLGTTTGARIAYLSCNPDTLARDLAALATNSSLRARRVIPLDLMPQTDHVEALALLD
jgi:23S rRNA (uracil-5-)-methyltransferase RumA